ncbi:TPA: tape measure protein [Pseudomonas aeruginosa]|uniref:tape measure protein n=1 Tax=Pseudomonas aeruginosa TaxID=287 RepID=UPI00159CD16F|nr:tape measure protein [Pseudomonas aeruginosa]QKZ83903.1 tape measure protein [Pseudomonas aeruginosa]HBP2372543.1 tape measure protein [Pseudomonas aeruginosa]HBP2411601.1 tape measure protein [Pseudomonas aeruginosa]HBP2418639.1 tape measure protein [Pseudomonas aeruginosa]HBP2425467.1 tape measure protein [Pseudomonas aeruginosa]
MASRSLGVLTLDLIARIGGFQQNMSRAAQDTARSMGRIEQSTQRASSTAVSAIKSIGVAAAAYLSARELVGYSQAWVSIENRIKQVSESQAQFSQSMEAVYSVAQNAQSSLEGTAELYQRIAASAGELGVNQQQVVQVTQNISKAMSASGVSAAAAEGALVQLGQAFASGVLRGQELNSVLEQAPGLAQAVANGLGVAVGDLRKLGEQGKLTSKQVFEAILSQTRAIDDQFARAQTTIAGAFQVLENSATRAIGSLDSTLGVSKAFTEAMVSLSKSLDSTGVQAFVQVLNTGLYLAIGRTAGALVSATAAKIADAKATQEQTYAASVAAAGEVRRAQAVKAEAVAELDRARQAVASARAQVAADRERQASEISRLRAVQASLVAERELEGQRLKAQITEIGRQQSVARMAELRLAETAIIKQLQAAEAQLTATTVAGSQAVTAALAQRVSATEALSAANLQLTAAQTASTAAMGRWFAASTALGAGLNALRTAGAGILRMAAGWPGLILSIGAVALSFVDFGDKAESNAGRAANAFEDASTRIRQAARTMIPEDLSDLSYDQLKQQLAGLQDQLKDAEALQERFQKGVDDNTDVPFGPSLDEAKEKAESLRLAIQKTQRELDGARFASDKAGASYLDNLQKQSVVAGKLTEVEKLRAQINAGILKLSPDDEKRALAYAAAVDKANASTKSQKDLLKDSAKGLKQAEERYRDLKKEIDPTAAATDEYRKNIEALNTLKDRGKVTSQEYAKGIEWAAKSFNSAVDAANPFVKRLREIKSAMDESLGNLKLEGQREILGMGMSDSQRGLFDKLNEENDRYAKARRDLADRYADRSVGMSDDEYQQELQAQQKHHEQMLEQLQANYDARLEAQGDWVSGARSAWETYVEDAQNYSKQASDFVSGALGDATNGLGDAITDIVTRTKSLGDAFGDMAADLAKSVIKALADMAAQWLVYQAVQLVVGKTAQSTAAIGLVANAQATAFQAQLAAFASTAAIPIVGPGLAAGAAAAAAAATAPMVAGVSSAAFAGIAHGGIDNIPKESTWLLDAGERVLSPNQNRDLTAFLSREGGASAGAGQAPSITINAPVTVNAQPGMSQEEARMQGEAAGLALREEVRSVIREEMGQNGLLWRR